MTRANVLKVLRARSERIETDYKIGIIAYNELKIRQSEIDNLKATVMLVPEVSERLRSHWIQHERYKCRCANCKAVVTGDLEWNEGTEKYCFWCGYEMSEPGVVEYRGEAHEHEREVQ